MVTANCINLFLASQSFAFSSEASEAKGRPAAIKKRTGSFAFVAVQDPRGRVVLVGRPKKIAFRLTVANANASPEPRRRWILVQIAPVKRRHRKCGRKMQPLGTAAMTQRDSSAANLESSLVESRICEQLTSTSAGCACNLFVES